MEIEIYPYKLERRTEYSKIQITSINTGKNISTSEVDVDKIIEDYYKQKIHPEDYFNIVSDEIMELKDEFREQNIKYLFIPDTIKKIHNAVFMETNIECVCLPSTLEVLGDGVFLGCNKLKDVYIPDSIHDMGMAVFKDCKNLESVILPSNITKIERNMFYNCGKLKKVIMPDGIESIEDGAFGDCMFLKTISLPKNLKEIKRYAFDGCQRLEKVDLPDGLKKIYKEAFHLCAHLKEIIIPDSVTEIDERAFSRCTRLSFVKLPNKLKELSYGVFDGCSVLENLTLPDTINTFNSAAFNGMENLTNINIPKHLQYINFPPFANCGVKSLTFNHDLKKLELYFLSASHDMPYGSNIDKLIISGKVKVITPDAINESGVKIRTIDYLGTREQFEQLKDNNKEFFKNLSNIQEINFLGEKSKKIEKDIEK